MIFHSSIAVEQPEKAARAVAQIWRGAAAPSPPDMFRGTWVAFGRDERGSLLEFHPLEFAFVLRSKSAEISSYDAQRGGRAGPSAVHFALASPRTEAEIHAIAESAGWESSTEWRDVPGGGYGVVEVWLENRVMIEVLTPEMQAQYAQTMGNIPKKFPPMSD